MHVFKGRYTCFLRISNSIASNFDVIWINGSKKEIFKHARHLIIRH